MFWSSGSKTSESGTGEDMLRSSSSFKGGPPGAGEVVELNVGGTVHAVSKATLLKVQGTLFTDLAKGKAKAPQDKDGRLCTRTTGTYWHKQYHRQQRYSVVLLSDSALLFSCGCRWLAVAKLVLLSARIHQSFHVPGQ